MFFRKRSSHGFTLMEVLTVVVIILILVTIALPVLRGMRERSEKAKCVANLRSLMVAANSYLQQKGHWPQIATKQMLDDYPAYAKEWIDVLKPFGIEQINWLCPSVQRQMGNPDLNKPENIRIDYIPMPFDSRQGTPLKWQKQPWFVERGDMHGNGNLVILTSGAVEEIGNIIPKAKQVKP